MVLIFVELERGDILLLKQVFEIIVLVVIGNEVFIMFVSFIKVMLIVFVDVYEELVNRFIIDVVKNVEIQRNCGLIRVMFNQINMGIVLLSIQLLIKLLMESKIRIIGNILLNFFMVVVFIVCYFIFCVQLIKFVIIVVSKIVIIISVLLSLVNSVLFKNMVSSVISGSMVRVKGMLDWLFCMVKCL